MKALKIAGIGVAVIFAIPLSLVLSLYTERFFTVQRGLASLGPAAPTLEVDGYTFRDLNKNGQLDPYEDSRVLIEARVDDLISQMSIEEKAGTLFIDFTAVGRNGELSNYPSLSNMETLGFEPNIRLVANKLMNHFSLSTIIRDPADFAKWQNKMQALAERTRLGIPITFASDPRHGVEKASGISFPAGAFSVWPDALGLAATREPALVRQFADIARREYRAVGIHLALHPTADLATEPRWARIGGTFGEDATLAAQMVGAYVLGFQGDELGPDGVATMVKHWAGGGPQEDGEDAHFAYGKNQVYPGNNFDYHLIPFTDGAFPAKAAQIMPYYGIPVGQSNENVGFAYNKKMISGLLRQTHGFDGVICTDWGLISDAKILGVKMMLPSRSWGVETLSKEERMVKLVQAGNDQFGGEHIPEMLITLVRDGHVAESRLDVSVRRVLRDKFRLGLFDDPYVDPDAAIRAAGREEFVRAGLRAQEKSLVLLKNGRGAQGSILPVSDRPKIYIENIDPRIAADYGDIVEAPETADLAIIRISAPFEPRNDLIFETFLHAGDLDFKEEERSRLLELLETVPTVVDIYLDRPAVIPEIAEASAALIANFGAEDRVILDLAFGNFAPSGKLPIELPSSMDAVRNQFEDLPYDSVDPLYQFGHGLSFDALIEISTVQ